MRGNRKYATHMYKVNRRLKAYKNRGSSRPSAHAAADYYSEAVSDDLNNLVGSDDYDYENSFDYEEYRPSGLPLTVDLIACNIAAERRPAQKKKHSIKKRAETTKVDSEEAKSADSLDFLRFAEPRLVRSKSSITLLHSQCSKRHQRRSSHVQSDDNLNTVHPPAARSLDAACCIQSLISARPSVVGPIPRASLSILSDVSQSAVLIIWFPLRVVPLVNCSPTLALELQRRIEKEATDENIELLHDWSSYWRLTSFLSERRQVWSLYLDRILVENSKSSPTDFFSLACRKAGMAIGRSQSHYHMLKEYMEKRPSTFSAALGEDRTTCEPTHNDGTTCLVCLDEISDSCQLLPCGHAACVDCYKAYLRSAAHSGQGSIKCAAHNCNVQIDMVDAAHILNDDDDDSRLLQRLVRFTLERSAPLPGRFCPAPHCGKRLQPCRNNVSERDGFNIAICDCGTSLCSDCDTAGPAHPGVSCPVFAKLWKTSALDDEVASVGWVLKHSRPCPKCRYPIQKDGGCNHVRCKVCEFYFCFECGGEGHLCMAYHCKNTNGGERYWQDDTAHKVEQHGALRTLASTIRAFRSIHAELATLIQEVGTDASSTHTSRWLEIECTRLLSWMITHSLARMTANTSVAIEAKAILQLEVTLHAIFLRNLNVQARTTKSQKALVGVLQLTQHAELSHCTENPASSLDCGKKEHDVFDSMFADLELRDLLTMDDARFVRSAKEAIQRGLQTFTSPVHYCTRRRRQVDKLHAQLLAPLNEKQSRNNDSWRNAVRRPNNYTDELSESSDNTTRNMKRSNRWKGKSRVSARRAATLEWSDA